MTEPKQVRSWIEQAEADLAAARTRGDGIAECHRRYWLQQSYEKAIKALALMKWTGGPRDETEFSKQFLLQHSPLTKVGATPTPLSKALRLLARELDAHVRRLDNGGILRQIDATTPTIDPAEVSYRYPFRRDGDFEQRALRRSLGSAPGDKSRRALPRALPRSRPISPLERRSR
jgi:hypothetical protein